MVSNSCDVPTEPLRLRASYRAALLGAEECSMMLLVVGCWGDVRVSGRGGGVSGGVMGEGGTRATGRLGLENHKGQTVSE